MAIPVTNQPGVWGTITSGATYVGNALATGAKKVAEFAVTAFQVLRTYAGMAWDGLCSLGQKAYTAGASGIELAKANPYVAGGVVAGVAAIGLGALLYNRCCGQTV